MPAFQAMTWNLENLFRPPADAPQEKQDLYQQKIAFLGGFLTQQDPDVLGLQEIGGHEPLLDLQLATGGAYPHSAVSAFPDGRGIRVGFLSKLPIQESADFVDFPPGPALDVHRVNSAGDTVPVTRMGRGALRIRVEVGGETIDLITAHLKSKLLTYPRSGGSSFTPANEGERAQAGGIALMRRTAEAVTLRIRVNELLVGNSDRRLLLMGDFNDVPEAQTSLILNGPSGSEIGTRGFDRPDKGDDARLFNVAGAIAEERRFSRIHRGRGELLDQIFASEELFPRDAQDDRQMPQVDSLIDYHNTPLPSVGDNPNERADKMTPDHAPVVAVFEI